MTLRLWSEEGEEVCGRNMDVNARRQKAVAILYTRRVLEEGVKSIFRSRTGSRKQARSA